MPFTNKSQCCPSTTDTTTTNTGIDLTRLPEYDDDGQAIANGTGHGEYYKLSVNNSYNLPNGMIKQVIIIQ